MSAPRKAQNTKILSYLKSGKKINQDIAFKRFNCYRLASRIHDLRCEGHNILTVPTERGNDKIASYKLLKTARR